MEKIHQCKLYGLRALYFIPSSGIYMGLMVGIQQTNQETWRLVLHAFYKGNRLIALYFIHFLTFVDVKSYALLNM